MTTELEHAVPAKAEAKSEWNTPKPETIPRPTYVPAAMAFGITLLLWGLVTSPVVLGMGLVLVTLSLIGWIAEMRHE